MSKWLVRTALALGVVAIACSSEVGIEDNQPASTAGIQPAGNGTAIDETPACEAIKQAIDAKAGSLNCKTIEVICPSHIRPGGGDACLQYDEGTVQACQDFIGKYRSCDDFAKMPCIVSTVPGSVSPGCEAPTPDAASDADSGNPDAPLPDASPDTGLDATPDAAPDAAADANLDGTLDGGADAAADAAAG